MTRAIPPHASLSPETLYFLNSKFRSDEDLAGAADLLSELRDQSNAVDHSISELNKELITHLTRHSTNSNRIRLLFSNVSVQLDELGRSAALPPTGGGPKRGMGDELQALTKEVARVETVRNYAETALKLDVLIGDVEDAVSSSMNRTLKKLPSKKDLEDMRAVGLRALKQAEEVLNSVKKKNPQWTRFVSAADHRIDRALAILRPQAIADHRALLTSLGWPPPLSTSSSSNPEVKGSSALQNPLFTVQGDLKLQYYESFMALCGLQELQRKRKGRQLKGHHKDVSLHQPLWVIEELVNPIAVASQIHFSKWIEKPEFIFALVYKITRDYVDSMDDLLQPLVDEAMLSGYSCREEWISAMTSSLSTYLAKEMFPVYISHLQDDSNPGTRTQACLSFLSLVDLMIAFDRRVQSLAKHSGLLLSLEEDGNMQKVSSLTVFCDRPDWLDLWAEIECEETLTKLNSQFEDERKWINDSQQVSVLSAEEKNKSPLISNDVLRRLKSVVDRCRTLPSIALRSRFVKLTCRPIINKFLDCLQQRCLEAEGMTALTDDNSLTKVAQSVNAAGHFESALQEFCEDIFFLEMRLDQGSIAENADGDNSTSNVDSEAPDGIFHEEIRKLQLFRTEWVEKLSTVILRGFDALCRDYVRNKKQWHEKGDDALTLSRSFIEAMDYLQAKLSTLEERLNKIDFTRVWRSLAAAVDKFVFSNILLGNMKFHDGGVARLSNDMSVLFGVFKSWCLRPEGFFPKIYEGIKLLKLEKEQLTSTLIVDERWAKDNGIRHLSTTEIEKIAKSRIFSS